MQFRTRVARLKRIAAAAVLISFVLGYVPQAQSQSVGSKLTNTWLNRPLMTSKRHVVLDGKTHQFAATLPGGRRKVRPV